MLSLIGWLVFGWIAGGLANWLLPMRTDRPATNLETIACGVVGSVIGGAAEGMLNGAGYRPAGLLWSIGGAAAAIWIWRALTETEGTPQ